MCFNAAECQVHIWENPSWVVSVVYGVTHSDNIEQSDSPVYSKLLSSNNVLLQIIIQYKYSHLASLAPWTEDAVGAALVEATTRNY